MMSEVKRYFGRLATGPTTSSTCDWVQASDYDTLATENAALRAEVESGGGETPKGDVDHWRSFWLAHALASQHPPSCLTCGHTVPGFKGAEDGPGIWNAALPNVVVCKSCVNALRQDRWVRVEDRLPEIGQEVLCAYQEHECVTVGDQDTEKWTQELFMGEGCDGYIDCYTIAYGSRSYVTHWMPLPAPPEEG